MSDTSHPRVHPSIPSHLGTELATLRLIQRRSAPQHRSAIFLRHVDHVVRTGRRVALELTIDSVLQRSKSSMTRRIQKFADALFRAADAATQMLALRHFVPLQTLLLAIYARLFSLASHLLDVLGSEVIKFQVSPAKLAITSAPSVMTEAPEIGERVERTVTPLPTTPVTQSIATQESLTQAPTGPRLERQVTRIQATTQKKKKQKKTSAIDDIFGL